MSILLFPVCVSIFIWVKGQREDHASAGHRSSQRMQQVILQIGSPSTREEKNESVGALLVGLKSSKLPALQGRRLFSLPNWSSLLEKEVELTEKSSDLLFTFRRFRNVLVAWMIKTLFTLFFQHAGSVPTHYNKHCLEQLFQLSTCPVFSLEGGPPTKAAADYAPHSTYVPINCVLGGNYQCHCSALRSSCEEVRHAGLILHIFTWGTVIRVEVNFPSRFIALRNDPALSPSSLNFTI